MCGSNHKSCHFRLLPFPCTTTTIPASPPPPPYAITPIIGRLAHLCHITIENAMRTNEQVHSMQTDNEGNKHKGGAMPHHTSNLVSSPYPTLLGLTNHPDGSSHPVCGLVQLDTSESHPTTLLLIPKPPG